MRLQDLQELFTNNSIASAGEHSEDLIQSVRLTRGISAERRLDVYRSNVTGLHLKTLDDTFPVIVRVLGEQYWHHLLQSEIETYSSTGADLNTYGKFVPPFLKKACEQRDELSDFAYLSDLAELEYLIFQAQFAADDKAFDWDSFGKLPPEGQAADQLVASSSLTLFYSDYPVDALWYSHQDNLPEQDFGDAPEGVYCCIYRDDQYKISVERVPHVAAQVIKKVESGASLAELQMDDNYEPDELIKLLFSWIHRGWIAGYKEG